MSLYLLRDAGIGPIGPARSLRAPIGRLSCAEGHRDAARAPSKELPLHRRFRRFGPKHGVVGQSCGEPDLPRPWHDFLTAGDRRASKRESEHAHPRILAVILAFALVAILTQAGW